MHNCGDWSSIGGMPAPMISTRGHAVTIYESGGAGRRLAAGFKEENWMDGREFLPPLV
jgi:hypothetical protein